MVGLLRTQQVHLQSLQLLGCIIAASTALSLAVSGDSWALALLGCMMLSVVVLVVLPNCFNISLRNLTAAILSSHRTAASGGSAACQPLARQSSQLLPNLDAASIMVSCCIDALQQLVPAKAGFQYQHHCAPTGNVLAVTEIGHGVRAWRPLFSPYANALSRCCCR